jgi:hypothetical protein
MVHEIFQANLHTVGFTDSPWIYLGHLQTRPWPKFLDSLLGSFFLSVRWGCDSNICSVLLKGVKERIKVKCTLGKFRTP